MIRRNTLLVVIAAIVAIVVVDELVVRFWMLIPGNGLVSEIIVLVAVVYIVAAIFTSGRIRFPSLPKRRRMHVVKQRDPSKAAADFIKQFEGRAKR